MFAAGCMGAVGDESQTPTPDGGTTTGKQGQTIYTRDVHPTMNKCSGGACHNSDASSAALGKFYAMDATAGYGRITTAPTIIGAAGQAFSSVAPILTKIAAGHQGVTYTSDEISKITNWLAKETEERKGSMPTMPVVDPKQVLKDFSGCLTLADFNTAQMSQKWGALAANNNQKCTGCHSVGGDGFIANLDANIMFPTISKYSGYMLKFFSVDTSTTPAKVVMNTGSFKNAGEVIASHPRFNPTTNAGITALKAWYDLAVAKQTAGGCGAATLTD
jgi:hypothetical protein